MSRVRKIESVAKLPEHARPPRILRVAAYVRVSTDLEEQSTSFEAQRDYYEKKIKENPEWILAGIYADEGKSGTSYINRTEFNRMMEDCRQGKIDMILTKSISRFARNTVDALNYIRELKSLNIGVSFERENIWTLDSKGEFLITLLTSLAQEESRSISENTAWGKRKAFADGKYSVAFSCFLGYDRGQNKNEFVVNQAQARIVRLIYRMFLQGYSTYKISQFLTKWGMKSPAGKDEWHTSSVLSILRNEKYKGDALLQKSFTRDFLAHKREKNKGELPQYYVQDGHEAIIDRGVFDYVQTLITDRTETGNGRFSGVHFYSSIFMCGRCGALYGSKPEHSNDNDTVENREEQVEKLTEDILNKKTEAVKDWLIEVSEESDIDSEVITARSLLSRLEDTEQFSIFDKQPEQEQLEGTISFYVAECMEFPVMGEYHNNLTLEEAIKIYESIPAERLHGIKGIGFDLQDGDEDYSGEYELMSADRIRRDLIDMIPHYKESPLVQKAIADMEKYLDEKHGRVQETEHAAETVIESGQKPSAVAADRRAEQEPASVSQSQPQKEEPASRAKGEVKKSVLQSLKDFQARAKAQEQNKTTEKSKPHKKGEVEL